MKIKNWEKYTIVMAIGMFCGRAIADSWQLAASFVISFGGMAALGYLAGLKDAK